MREHDWKETWVRGVLALDRHCPNCDIWTYSKLTTWPAVRDSECVAAKSEKPGLPNVMEPDEYKIVLCSPLVHEAEHFALAQDIKAIHDYLAARSGKWEHQSLPEPLNPYGFHESDAKIIFFLNDIRAAIRELQERVE